ncbi:MAG: DNA repair protein RecN [Gammaproteobacteria bacterium]|nr:DNA repair protein RecN [Gammaproteobacteria bacterium]
MALASLYVRDFAIVRKNDLDLDAGLTVVTGETGAGKSIMIDALDLVLGARADSNVIRHGTDSAEIVAGFELQAGDDAAQWLVSHELDDGGGCVLRRILYSDKPTRAYINDRPVTVQTLRDLGDLLVDIHGQHEHQSLLKKDVQRRILDDYAGQTGQVEKLAALYEEHRSLSERLESLSSQAGDRASQLELYRYQLEELDQLALGENEYLELEQEHDRLAHASELLEGMQFAAEALYDADDDAVNDVLAQAIHRIESLAEYEPRLSEVLSMLNNARVEIEEAAGELHHLLDRTELDPQRLNWLADRIGTITDLARKHHCEPEGLIGVAEQLRQWVGDLEDSDTNLEAMRSRIARARRDYDELARAVGEARREAAGGLAEAVTGHMQELGMAGGGLNVEIETEEGEPTRYGYEKVDFNVAANRGTPARPLNKVASGGELSRISLAIQVVIARLGRVPTLVFDEVDVGIGGRVAEIVGQQLRTIGSSRQVLCITHLPQVAAQGHQHMHVVKHDIQPVQVEIKRLDDEERVEELARMLGGIDITEQTLAHARDMLARSGRSHNTGGKARTAGA